MDRIESRSYLREILTSFLIALRHILLSSLHCSSVSFCKVITGKKKKEGPQENYLLQFFVFYKATLEHNILLDFQILKVCC